MLISLEIGARKKAWDEASVKLCLVVPFNPDAAPGPRKTQRKRRTFAKHFLVRIADTKNIMHG